MKSTITIYLPECVQNFLRKYLILILAVLSLTVWTWISCTIAATVARREEKAELTKAYEYQITAAVQAVREEYEGTPPDSQGGSP